MATAAIKFRWPDFLARTAERASIPQEAVRREASPYALRALPNEDVFFFTKRIDNTRVVREADPRSKAQCWSAIGAACVLVAMLTTVLAPNVAGTMAGYKIQQLKIERQRLLDERTFLRVEEARLESASRLGELARSRQMDTPKPGQVVHLDTAKDKDGSLARNLQAE